MPPSSRSSWKPEWGGTGGGGGGVCECVSVCVSKWAPPRAGEQAAAQKPGLHSPATDSDTQSLDHQAGGYISLLFYLVRKSLSFQWSTSREFPFLQQITGGMGRKGNGGREGEGLLFLNPCQALVLWRFLWGKEKGRKDGKQQGIADWKGKV